MALERALLAALLASPLVLSPTAHAANLAEYDLANANASVSDTVEVQSTAAEVSASDLRAHGDLDPPFPVMSTFLHGGWPSANALDPTKYYEFSITPDLGHSIQYQQLALAVGSGGSGTGTFQIRASLDGFASAGQVVATQSFPKNAMWHAFDVDLSALGTQAGTVTFRFYMYLVGGNAYSGVGSNPAYGNQGRNLVVHGTVRTGEPVDDCVPSATILCVDDQPGDRRFQARVVFATSQGSMPSGPGRVIPLNNLGIPSGGIFWFTNPENPEMLLKVLNGCAFNGHFWVFYAAGTNFALDVEVTDTATGATWVMANPDRRQAPPVGDTLAFPCSAAAEAETVARDDRTVEEWVAAMEDWTDPNAMPAETVDLVPREACSPDATTLCVDDQPGDGRFEARVFFQTTQGGQPMGFGTAIPLSSLGVPSGGIFWFTNPQNPEMLLKVLNGCGFNQHFWVFYAAGTNFALEVEVTDTATGALWTSVNPDRRQAPPIGDTLAFPCQAP